MKWLVIAWLWNKLNFKKVEGKNEINNFYAGLPLVRKKIDKEEE